MSQDDYVLETLQSIENLLKSLVRIQLGPVVDKELSDSTKRKIYELTGRNTVREVAQKVKCSKTKVSNIWQRWEAMGLVIKEGKVYRKVL